MGARRFLCLSLVTLAAVLLAEKSANAAIITFTNQATWSAAANPTFTETFSSFATDTQFRTVAVNVNGNFTLQQQGTGTFRNTIDVAPFLFGDNNGTTHSSTFTDFGATTVLLSFSSPVGSFGADFSGVEGSLVGAEGLTIDVLSPTNTVLASLVVPNNSGTAFFGFVGNAGEAIGSLILRSTNSGGGGEGFGLDNVQAGAASVPEPASLALWSILGLTGGIGAWRRRKAKTAG